ncbi:uncharacterized protein LOC114050004 isoform X4 [Vombatus ursinus]|uniref:uncharacterized protein LOC114050004 isoform X4 n=1 Tax=Vombatus ursinus TaxID=29139 RepID=UPI000FFD2983|nr:uncharacterized protein LOC114050004 isoform X4 [Vombatus ursinus]
MGAQAEKMQRWLGWLGGGGWQRLRWWQASPGTKFWNVLSCDTIRQVGWRAGTAQEATGSCDGLPDLVVCTPSSPTGFLGTSALEIEQCLSASFCHSARLGRSFQRKRDAGFIHLRRSRTSPPP